MLYGKNCITIPKKFISVDGRSDRGDNSLSEARAHRHHRLLLMCYPLRLSVILLLGLLCIAPALKAASYYVTAPQVPALQQALDSEPEQAITLAENYIQTLPAGRQLRNKAIAYQIIARALGIQRKGELALFNINRALALARQAKAPLLEAQALYNRGLLSGIVMGQYQETEDDITQALSVLEAIAGSNYPPLTDQHLELMYRCHQRLASLFIYVKKIPLAGPHLQQAKDLAVRRENIRDQIEITLEQAKYGQHQRHNKYTEEKLLQASRLIPLIEDPELEGQILEQTARFYRRNEQFELALQYSNKAIEIYQQHQMTTNLSVALNGIGIIYEAQGNQNLALVNYLNSLKLIESGVNKVSAARTQHNIGVIYQSQQKHDKAHEYLGAANRTFNQLQHPYFLMVNSHALAQLQFDTDQPGPAEENAAKALALAEQLEDPEYRYLSHLLTAQLHAHQQRYEEAMTHFQHSLDWQKTMLEPDEDQHSAGDNLQQTTLQQQLEESEQRLVEQHGQLDRQRQLFYLATGACVLLLLALAFFVMRNYVHVGENRELRRQNERQPGGTLPDLLRRWHQAPVAPPLLHINGEPSATWLVLFDCPALSDLPARLGIESGHQLQQQWLSALQEHCQQSLQQLNQHQYLLPIQRQNGQSLAEALDELQHQLLDSRPAAVDGPMAPTAMAVIDHQFFGNPQEHLNDKQRLELLNLTQWGARWLADHTNASAWLHLQAKRHAHAAILYGDIYQQCLKALHNSFFTVYSNQPEPKIPWPQPQ